MLSKCDHLWECKVIKDTSFYEHSNESIEITTLNTNDEMKNNQLRYDALILEGIFHEVWLECNGTLYWATID